MAIDTRIAGARRRSPMATRRSTLRPLAWIRHYPGAQTAPTQQAIDAISHSPEFPRH